MDELKVYAMAFLLGMAGWNLAYFIIKRLRRWEANANRIAVLPSESDLRRRDEENARKAFIRYTCGKGRAA